MFRRAGKTQLQLVHFADTLNFHTGLRCHVSHSRKRIRLIKTRWYHRLWWWFRRLFEKKWTVTNIDRERGVITLE